ncbi:MAG: glycosyltransferase family 4 protein [Pyrinomonadaceae bacterium]
MSSTESKKRKLIFLWTYTDWGGAQLYMLTIMRLAAQLWDVVVVLPMATKKDVLAFYEPYDLPIEFLNHHFDAKVETSVAGKVRRQFQRIRSEITAYRHLRKFDLRESILHIEIAPWQSWVLLCLLCFRGGNVFTTLNNFPPDAPKWRKLVWKTRLQILSRLPRFHIFASNRYVKDSLREWLTPQYWDSVPIAYSPIDSSQIAESRESNVDLASIRRKFDLVEEDFVILAVGQFVDRKGRWVFLEAAKKVLEQAPNSRFVWLMPSPLTEEDRVKVESYLLFDRFVPVISQDVGKDRVSIFNFFRIADAFALPSYIEGLPIALLEAMALGVPSISTNVYAIPEAIMPDKTGILIEPGDSTALAEAILRIKSDARLRERLSRDGSQFAIENFDGRIMASTYLEAYRKCFDS